MALAPTTAGTGTAATATATATATAAASAAAASRPRLAANFDTFLTLLTTQLRNQSPTEPLDTNQMTQQLVQFASVEQQIAMNANMERSLELQGAAQLTAAAPLMGRAVEVEGDRLALQDGRAELRLPARSGDAVAARVVVTDDAGTALRSAVVPLEAGRPTSWTWDGRRDDGAAAARDGSYRVSVQGVTASGSAAGAAQPFTVVGTATGAERRDGALRLMLGAAAYGFDKVRSVTATR